MKLVMQGKHLKMLHRAIVYLARIGNALFFEASPKGLIIRAVRYEGTSFTWVMFHENFFYEIDVKENDDETDEFDENNFRLSVKPCLRIFRNTKDVDRCTIQMDMERAKLMVYMECAKRIRKIRMISILNHDRLGEPDLPETRRFLNKFSGTASLFSKILSQFPVNSGQSRSTGNKDVTIEFDMSDKKVKVRNFIENPDRDMASTRTEYKLSLSEFQDVRNQDSNMLSVYLKDLKAVVQFANQTKNLVKIRYCQPGDPILLSVVEEKDNFYTAKLLMTSLNADIIEKSRRKEQELLQNNAKRLRDKRLQSSVIQTESDLNRPSIDMPRNGELVTPQSHNNATNTSVYHVKDDNHLNTSKKRKKLDPKEVAHYKRIRDIAYGREPSKTMSSLRVSARESDAENIQQDVDIQRQLLEMSQVLQNEVEDPFPEISEHLNLANNTEIEKQLPEVAPNQKIPFKKPAGFTYKHVAPKPTECTVIEPDTSKEKQKSISIFEGINLPSTSKNLTKPTTAESEELFSSSVHDSHVEIDDSDTSTNDELQRKLYHLFRPCFEPTQGSQELLMLAGDVLAYNSDPE